MSIIISAHQKAFDFFARSHMKDKGAQLFHCDNSATGTRRWVDTVGKTPMIDLSRLSPNASVEIYAKAEFLNPSGSVKVKLVTYSCLTFI